MSAQLELLAQGVPPDPKTELQEKAQAQNRVMPIYELIETWGPAHEKRFKVRVSVSGVWLAEGTGRSKRAAERDAAQGALSKLTEQLSVAEVTAAGEDNRGSRWLIQVGSGGVAMQLLRSSCCCASQVLPSPAAT